MPARLRFILRDDDTSYFTEPRTLEAAYEGIWSWCPVSLAVIPFAVHTVHLGDPERFRQDGPPHALAGNRELVRFLARGVARNRLSVLLHGWSHRYEQSAPGEWIPEFVYVDDPLARLVEGQRHLRETLGRTPTVFVPPSNALSARSYAAVRQLRLHLTAFHPMRLSLMRPEVEDFTASLRRLRARVRRREYHDVLRFGLRREVSAISLTPRTDPRRVFTELVRRQRLGGSVCLATHHWELASALTAGTGTVGELLDEVLAWLRRSDAIPMRAEDLLA